MNKAVRLGKRGDPWFEDGNIILVPEDSSIYFKVHRDFLSRHSEIFKSMFELPQPTADAEILDECQVVRMYDLPVELSNLIKALYDGSSPLTRGHGIDDFLYTAGILRLSTKYFITRLRAQAIQHLMKTWSNTLRGHDQMIELALKAPHIDDKSYPYVHPLHVLNLARSTNVQIILPLAIYFLSLYPLTDILAADHPKLTIKHASCPSSDLSPQDLQAYTLMYQARVDIMLDFVRSVCGDRSSPASCQNEGTCIKAFTRVSSIQSRSWRIRTGPLHFMVQVSEQIADNPDICGPCKRAFRQDVTTLREDVWRRLPSLCGLPSWSELEALDLTEP
ncbi:hypothetical protein EIP91_002866 [Steccherinum ochraceum]|uniref:BTB domain-containing protein n=1 Tax=Steccherinum ochraceum TaxID=92696 RepID=A0A4R0RPB4_9APHY|nr:hypothetical protein EIP91_002866 [Steccherinum ochraceum]